MNPTGSALITVEHEAELWRAGIARWTTRCRCSSSSSSLIDEKTCDRWKRCTRKRRIISVREKAIIANSIPNPEITINLLSLSVKFSIRFDNSTRRVQRGRFDNYPLCSKTRLDSIRSTPPLLPPSGIEPIPRWCIRARISLIDSIPRRAEFQSRTGETVSTLAFGNYV